MAAPSLLTWDRDRDNDATTTSRQYWQCIVCTRYIIRPGPMCTRTYIPIRHMRNVERSSSARYTCPKMRFLLMYVCHIGADAPEVKPRIHLLTMRARGLRTMLDTSSIKCISCDSNRSPLESTKEANIPRC